MTAETGRGYVAKAINVAKLAHLETSAWTITTRPGERLSEADVDMLRSIREKLIENRDAILKAINEHPTANDDVKQRYRETFKLLIKKPEQDFFSAIINADSKTVDNKIMWGAGAYMLFNAVKTGNLNFWTNAVVLLVLKIGAGSGIFNELFKPALHLGKDFVPGALSDNSLPKFAANDINSKPAIRADERVKAVTEPLRPQLHDYNPDSKEAGYNVVG